MCYICNYCCICLCDKTDLQRLSNSNNDELNYFIKLTTIIPEMCFKEMNDQRLLCKECLDIIDEMYKYREKCLKSKTILIDCMAKLHTDNEVSDKMNLSSSNVTQNNVTAEKYIKTEYDEQNMEEENYYTNFSNTINLDSNKIGSSSTIFSQNCIKKEEIDLGITYVNVQESIGFNDGIDKNNIYKENDQQTISCERNETFSNSVKSETCISENDNEEGSYEAYYIVNTHENSHTFGENEQQESLSCDRNETTFSSSLKSEPAINENDNEDDSDEKYDIGNTHENSHTFGGHNIEETTQVDDKAEDTLEKQYECRVCFRKFNLKRYLYNHLQSHTEAKFDCTICEKKFKQQYHLTEHMHTHLGERRFACNICHKKFLRSNHLKGHLKIHGIDKETKNWHNCTLCDKKFKQNNHLAGHMKMHEANLFVCKICDKKFQRSKNLRNHMRTHKITVDSEKSLVEKRFECTVCFKKFTRNYDLITHMRIHTGLEPYVCKICNQKFMRLYLLKTHLKSHDISKDDKGKDLYVLHGSKNSKQNNEEAI